MNISPPHHDRIFEMLTTLRTNKACTRYILYETWRRTKRSLENIREHGVFKRKMNNANLLSKRMKNKRFDYLRGYWKWTLFSCKWQTDRVYRNRSIDVRLNCVLVFVWFDNVSFPSTLIRKNNNSTFVGVVFPTLERHSIGLQSNTVQQYGTFPPSTIKQPHTYMVIWKKSNCHRTSDHNNRSICVAYTIR